MEEDEDLLISEGKLFFPRIHKVGDGYSISKRIKGLHKRQFVINELLRRKICYIADLFTTNYKFSQSSKSVYFEHLRTNYRISDHFRGSFEGIQIIIDWKTPVKPHFNIEYYKQLNP